MLRKVIHPNGLIREFITPTANATERLGDAGYTEYAAVSRYVEYYRTGSGIIYNCDRRYDYDDYSSLHSALTSSNSVDGEEIIDNHYHTTVYELHQTTDVDSGDMQDWNSVNTTYSFNSRTHSADEVSRYEHEFLQYEDLHYQQGEFNYEQVIGEIDYQPKLVQKNTYEYDIYRNPTKVTVALYDRGADVDSMSYSYQYTYDWKGNILTETKPNGLIITNTYSEEYSIPLTTTYKQNDTTTIVSTNTLTSDKKSIAQNTVTSNNTTVGKTVYTYDSYGRVLTEKRYSSSYTYAETQYAYTVGHAQPTAIISKDVRNVDDTLVTGTTGYSNGQLAVRYAYNDKGEITSQIDADGNIVSIQYDAVGRITKVTNPDGTSANYTYDVANNTVLYTDERGTTLRYEYDPFGNLTGIYDIAGSQYLSEAEYGCYGWPISETQYSSAVTGSVTRYRYDASGRAIDVRTESLNGAVTSRVKYDFSYEDSLAKVEETVMGDTNAPDIVTTSYVDNMGHTVKTGKFLNGAEHFDTYTYDNVGNVRTVQTAYSASLGDDYTYQYTYDVNGNIRTQKDTISAKATLTILPLSICCLLLKIV